MFQSTHVASKIITSTKMLTLLRDNKTYKLQHQQNVNKSNPLSRMLYHNYIIDKNVEVFLLIINNLVNCVVNYVANYKN